MITNEKMDSAGFGRAPAPRAPLGCLESCALSMGVIALGLVVFLYFLLFSGFAHLRIDGKPHIVQIVDRCGHPVTWVEFFDPPSCK